MRNRAEKLGQEFLAVFADVKLARRGAAIREGTSGIGFVDVLVTFSSGLLHIVELKILKGRRVPGPAQLGIYMRQKRKKVGWLVLFDTRKASGKAVVPSSFNLGATGKVRTIVININPIPPHLA